MLEIKLKPRNYRVQIVSSTISSLPIEGKSRREVLEKVASLVANSQAEILACATVRWMSIHSIDYEPLVTEFKLFNS